MKLRTFTKVAAFLGMTVLATSAVAQRGGPPPGPPPSPRDAAPINLDRLEGQWVAIVNEDWLWRMRVAEKGDFTSIPYNDRAREVGQAWDESMIGSCLAYGAAGIMRQPQRLRIEWESDSVVRLETDYGQQTRRFIFNEPAPENTPSSLQGYSMASWEYDAAPPVGFAGFSRSAADLQHGSMKIETSHLTAAWLRSNGAPVSANATVTEYVDVFADPNGNDWVVFTTIVHDPEYLNTDFITSSHYRRDNDRSAWDPRPCGM
jgi:hypothetical protein